MIICGNSTTWSASLSLGVGDGAAQGIRFEENVGIRKEQPLTRRLIGGGPHGVCFAEPTRRKFAVMNHTQRVPRPCLRAYCGDRACPELVEGAGVLTYPIQYLARPVRRAIVDRDHLVVVVVERKQSIQRRLNRLLLIAGRNNDGYARIARREHGISIPLRPGNIGHTGHPKRGIHDAGDPRQRENGSRNPVKIGHRLLLCRLRRSKCWREFHSVEQYGRRDHHGDDWKHKRHL